MKLLRTEHPELFNEIAEMIVKDIEKTHRRNSNFFTISLIEFKEEHSRHYPNTPNFKDFIGHWVTNQYLSDPEHGTDWLEITELTKVQKQEKTITVHEWAPV
jgi:hypothetical protein